jgi:hypothetical protein
MKSINLKFYLTLLLLLILFFNVKAQYTLTDNDVVVVDGVIESCSYNFAVTDIIIPEILDGQTVVGLVDGEWDYVSTFTSAFYQKGITSVQLPSTIEFIGNYSFLFNVLTSIDLSNCTNLTRIGDGAFSNNRLTSLDLSECTSLLTLGEEAFSWNYYISSLKLSSSIVTIGTQAFSNNDITQLDLSMCTNLVRINGEAFLANKIAILVINNNTIEYIGSKAFYSNKLTSVDFTQCTSLTKISSLAFSFNEITSLNFQGCTSLEQIGTSAFSENQIPSVDLSTCSSLTTIEAGAFYDNVLTSFNLPIITLPYFLNWTDGSTNYANGALVSSLLIKYYAVFKSVYTLTDDDVVVIDGFIQSCSNAGDVDIIISEILDGQTIIGIADKETSEGVFSGWNLKTVQMPITMQYIGNYAFQNNSLETLDLSGFDINYIGQGAFYSNSMNSLDLSGNENLTKVETISFGLNNLTSISIPSSIDTIKTYAFFSNSLSSVVFEDNSHICLIEADAFNDNYTLSSLVLPAPIKDGYTFSHWLRADLFTMNAGDIVTYPSEKLEAIFIENTGNTSATITRTVCDEYISPSGIYTYTNSGTYKDTISNAAGADSLLTIILTVNETSFGTHTEISCESFVSPSSNYIWSNSGVYKDTIPNYAGCDSVITINLTILNSTSSNINETNCDNYTSPSGNYTWTSSGVYKDTIPNEAGCDSVITVDLTINNSTSSAITESAVDSYTSPSGNYTWNVSGTYKDTIPNYVGCDSVLTINLTVTYTSNSTIVESTCDSYDSPSGKLIWTTSGTYKDTVLNSEGTDSVITIILTVNYSTSSDLTITACEDYLSPSGNDLWTTSGTYKDTIPNAAGCDSIMIINLIREYPTSSSITATSCNNYTSPSEKYVWTSTGIYNDTILNAVGCDSVITVDLTINTLDDIEIISQNGSYEISEDGGSLSFTMQTTPEVTECETIWFFGGDTHLASFENEVLSACGCGEGEIILRAYSLDDPSIYDEKTITITNQTSGQVTNSNFDTDVNNWFLWTPDCNNSVVWENAEAKIIIGDSGSDCWSQFMNQDYMTVVQGKSYSVNFDAYASVDNTIYCLVRENGGSYTSLSNEPAFNLTTTKQTFSFEFTASEPTSTIGQVHFNFGGNNETIWIDNVSFCEKEIVVHQLQISKIQGTSDISPYANQLIETEGEVTQVNEFGCFIQDANNVYSGIFVYNADFSTLSVGDGLKLKGTIDEYNGLTEIKDIEWSETFNSTYNIVPLDMNQEELSEKHESILIKAANVEAIEENEYSNWLVSFGNNVQILIDDKYYSHELTAGNLYNITGIVYYRFDVFGLNPRFNTDIEDLGAASSPVAVTFQVNMQNEEVTNQEVGIAGSWDNGSELIALTANGEIYSATIDLEIGSVVEYKFINSSSITDNDSYEVISGDCTNSNGYRYFTIPATETTLDLVCFASCENCATETAINSLSNSKIDIYPNPANNIVYINLNDIRSAKIILIDVLGRKLLELVSDETIESVDLESYKSGIYFLIIDNGSSINSFKLIIK